MVGAACAWRTPSGWTGRRFHLGSNKEAFDAEVYAIYQAPNTMDQRQESRRRYTLFVDSASAISRIRLDDIGPGQRFAVASVEVASRILTRGSEVATRWVPAHHEDPGNERVDEFAKAAAEGGLPRGCRPRRVPIGDQPVAHDKSGYRGPGPDSS